MRIRVFVICFILMFSACTGFSESAPSFRRYGDILAWVQENKPMSLDLGETSLKITQIEGIRQAMPDGATLDFSFTWCKATLYSVFYCFRFTIYCTLFSFFPQVLRFCYAATAPDQYARQVNFCRAGSGSGNAQLIDYVCNFY